MAEPSERVVESLFSNRMLNTSTAIIAGGKSSRFGTNKANARFQNKRFSDIAVQIGYKRRYRRSK